MKYYTYIYTIASIALIAVFSACNDDYLERYPLDKISQQNFFKTEPDLANYNNSLYAAADDDKSIPIMLGVAGNEGAGMWWTDFWGNDLAPTNDRVEHFFRIRAGKHHIPVTPVDYGYKGWDFVRKCNFGLANYNRADIPEKTIHKYKAEARLFRGWFYADKVSKFGDVQWVDKVLDIDSPELFEERNSREFVMEKVLDDLNYACDSLPESWNDDSPGRLNRWCALAVKSRVCLFEGTWRKYHDGFTDHKMWLEEAASAAEELMNNGPFEIYSTGDSLNDYRYPHYQLDLSDCKEVIYWVKHQHEVNTHYSQRYMYNYNGGATKDFVDDFLCTDGRAIANSPRYKGDDSIEVQFRNRDPRLRQCVLYPRDRSAIGNTEVKLDYGRGSRSYPRVVNMGGSNSHNPNTGFSVIKYYNYIDDSQTRDDKMTSTVPTLRLAEVLLNYAEAKAELNTLTQADLDNSINKLRDRVNMAHLKLNPELDPKYAHLGLPSIIIEIRRERRVELFLEGFRYNDLRRWKQGKQLAQTDLGLRWEDHQKLRLFGSVTNADANVQWSMHNSIPYIDVRKGTEYEPIFDESKHYLWPIPVSVISDNPKIKQNPGWQ